jgi:cytoskeleton protein RodZ
LPPAEPAPHSEGLVLTLSARQSCWVKVKADGETVLDEVMQEGQTKTLEAHGELVLSVGNAGGLSFTVNDRPGVPLGRSGEVRRNIVITRESLPSLVQDHPVAASHSG